MPDTRLVPNQVVSMYVVSFTVVPGPGWPQNDPPNISHAMSRNSRHYPHPRPHPPPHALFYSKITHSPMSHLPKKPLAALCSTRHRASLSRSRYNARPSRPRYTLWIIVARPPSTDSSRSWRFIRRTRFRLRWALATACIVVAATLYSGRGRVDRRKRKIMGVWLDILTPCMCLL